MSELRMWLVPVEYTIEFDMVVLAADAEKARSIAKANASEEREALIDDEEVWVTSPREVGALNELDDELRRSVPWTDDDDEEFQGTAAQWFEQNGGTPASSLAELEAAGQLNMLVDA